MMVQNNEYLAKLHEEILVIMDEIHRVCIENRITYYLSYGSLLGAVRHKGSIPWDDDLDITMPREDFNLFLSIAPKFLNSPFQIKWIDTDKHYLRLFAKVCNSNTLFKEDGYDFITNGIFVDVFPLDYSPSYSNVVKRKKREIMFLHNIVWHKIRHHNSIKYWPSRLLGMMFSNYQITKLIIKRSMDFSKKGKSHYTNFVTPYSPQKETMPIEWFGEGKLAAFEDRKYVIPSQPEKILRNVYGVDYMELPPEDKRKTHYPRRIVFSDGIEMVFETPNNKVSYNDIM